MNYRNVVALTLLMAFSIAAYAQEGPAPSELALGKEYAAGTTVLTTRLGISMKVPRNLAASVGASGGFFSLKGDAGVGLVLMRTGLSVPELKGLLEPEMDLTFLHPEAWVERAAEPVVDGRKISATYRGEGVFGRVHGESGEKGCSYLAIILATSDAAASASLKELTDSIKWQDPKNSTEMETGRGLVLGQRLSISAGGESLVGEFTREGTYTLKYTSGEQSQTESGKWRVELGILNAVLVLTAGDGTVKSMAMAVQEGDILLDGTRYKREPMAGQAAAPAERPAEAADKGKSRKVKADPNWKSDIKEVEKLEGDELQFNQQYEAGKRIKTDFLGVSFALPQGTRGGSDGKTPVFLMVPEDRRGFGILGLQTGVNDAATAAILLQEEIDLGEIEAGAVLRPDGAAKIEGGKVTQEYRHEKFHARAVMLIGPSGNSVAVSFIGLKEDREKLDGYLDALLKSVQIAKPKAEERREAVRKDLGGKCLHVFRYKAVNSGIGNSASWETNIWYHFGSDNTYFYRYRYTSSMAVEGRNSQGDTTHTGGAASDNNRDDKGTWRIEFNIVGIVLVLKNEAGEETVHQIRQEPGKVFLNGEEVSVGQSDIKK